MRNTDSYEQGFITLTQRQTSLPYNMYHLTIPNKFYSKWETLLGGSHFNEFELDKVSNIISENDFGMEIINNDKLNKTGMDDAIKLSKETGKTLYLYPVVDNDKYTWVSVESLTPEIKSHYRVNGDLFKFVSDIIEI